MDTMLNQALEGFLGLLRQLMTNLLGPNGSEWGEELKKFLRKEPCWVVDELEKLVSGVSCLKLISLGEKILIPATTGKRTIAKAKAVFPGYIDGDFVNYGCDIEGASAPETQTDVYELVEDGNYRKIFGSFGVNLDLLCLTQDQIITWVENNRHWLRTDGYGTFFLFKENGEFFVAHVSFDGAGALEVYVSQLSDGLVWYAFSRHRIVFPQLTTSTT
ncbi:MAG: hypothetical protein ACYCZW_03375 [Minisyncoccota bacterium]